MVVLCTAVLLPLAASLGTLSIIGSSLVLGGIPATISLLGLSIPTLGLVGAGLLTKALLLKAKSGATVGASHTYGGGGYRHKRSAEQDNLIDAIGPMLDVQAQLDRQTGCGMKLICELSAKHHAGEELTEEEELLLILFGSDQGIYSLVKSKSKGLYHLSSIMGRQHGRAYCVEVFEKCSLSSDAITQQLA